MSDYYCPHCGADLGDQYGFDPDAGYWTCTECGQFLMDDDIADGDEYDGVAWFCDNCNALLNRQSGFSDSYSTWTCTECGHTNGLSEEDILEDQHKCPACGANLKKQWSYSEYMNDYTCSECSALLHRDYSSDEFTEVDDDEKCPNCGAYLKNQWGFSDYEENWICTECNAELHREYSSDPFTVVDDEHKCPNCGASLFKQSGYNEYSYDWTCTECDAELHRDYSGAEFDVVDEDEDEEDEIDYSGFSSYDSDSDEEEESYYDSEEYQERMREAAKQRAEEARRRQEELARQRAEEARRRQEEQQKREEEQRIKAEKRRESRKKLWRTLTGKKQTAGIAADACRSMNYSDVVRILEAQEFHNIATRIVEDLSADEKAREGIVDKVSFNGVEVFDKDTQFPYSASIEVVYHMMKRQKPPITSRGAKRKDVDDISWEFSNAGFVNIERIAIPDLSKGWLVKEDSVESVEIDGKTDFRKSDLIRIDAKIVVRYHTFKTGKG